jgi:hypothetical protein
MASMSLAGRWRMVNDPSPSEATGQLFRNSPRQVFLRQAEHLFPFSRLMLG